MMSVDSRADDRFSMTVVTPLIENMKLRTNSRDRLWGWGEAGAFNHTPAGRPANDPDGVAALMTNFIAAIGGGVGKDCDPVLSVELQRHVFERRQSQAFQMGDPAARRWQTTRLPRHGQPRCDTVGAGTGHRCSSHHQKARARTDHTDDECHAPPRPERL